MERGSPKSCFLFLGSVLCEVNWVSVLSDAWSPSPRPETRGMVVCLLFMMILLAKEDQLVDQTVSFWRACDQDLAEFLRSSLCMKLLLFSFPSASSGLNRCMASGMCLQLAAWFSQTVHSLRQPHQVIILTSVSFFISLIAVLLQDHRVSFENWILNTYKS